MQASLHPAREKQGSEREGRPQGFFRRATRHPRL